MKHQLFKRLKKLWGQRFTLIMVPNCCNKKIHSCRIPFIAVLTTLILSAVNIYIFFAYSTQIWQIVHFRQKISLQNKMITKLTTEKSQVMPVLEKSRIFEGEFTRYRQANQEMLNTWERLRQKGNPRFSSASRGSVNRGVTNGYVLPPISGSRTVTTSLDQLGHNLEQLERILKKEAEEQKQLFLDFKVYERFLDHTPSLWPVHARISSPFGVRFHPIFRRYFRHEGVDLAVEYGTKIRAAADGRVSFAGWAEGYGLLIRLDHDYGFETRYGHNSRLLVHAGETVKKGQVICLSGNTGESTGPHLHYEVRMNNKPVNPVSFLKE